MDTLNQGEPGQVVIHLLYVLYYETVFYFLILSPLLQAHFAIAQ